MKAIFRVLREEAGEADGGNQPAPAAKPAASPAELKIAELRELQNRLMKVERQLAKADGVKKGELEEIKNTLADEIRKIAAEVDGLKAPKAPAQTAKSSGITGIDELDEALFHD